MESLDTHDAVLLEEALEALAIKADGLYVDATFGRGGHSQLILSRLGEEGRLLVIDKDPEAIAHAKRLFAADDRVSVVHGSFASLGVIARDRSLVGEVDGVLMDLGVSSPQLNDPQRGFSFTHDGPLDMRMDPTSGVSAAEWVNSAPEKEISRVIKEFGEERFARRMARAIVAYREQKPFSTTSQLAEVVKQANPAWEKGKHPATRAFQAIRIHINAELGDLSEALQQAVDVLSVGGRLVVISFHSLEDRLVKRFIRAQQLGPQVPRHIPIRADQVQQTMRAVGKAVKPGAAEVERNVRARSAVMRIAEKVA